MKREPKLLFPLDTFYKEVGEPLPPVGQVEGDTVPEPYRRLLVGNHDMTPTLEAFHGARIHLQLLERHLDGEALTRLVVLRLDGSNRPVEFGAIVIHLNLYPPAARDLILAGECPLGTILALHDVRHSSCPRAFIRVMSDARINAALGLSQPQELYGRRNILVTPDGHILADIVEILPPE